ncbi:MAG TPA: HDOD domain-containing protein, partial [Marinobacter sp.]|nr:HDOD domain-containing protein [Marinobacter sp.]
MSFAPRIEPCSARKGPLAAELTLDDVAARLQKLYRLPPMPALALRILALTAEPEATAKQLAEVIELDPSMTAQLMRYARSALFGY